LQKAIERYPNHRSLYYDLALALYQEKKYGEAREVLLQLPENQRDVIARELLSEIQLKIEKWTKSID